MAKRIFTVLLASTMLLTALPDPALAAQVSEGFDEGQYISFDAAEENAAFETADPQLTDDAEDTDAADEADLTGEETGTATEEEEAETPDPEAADDPDATEEMPEENTDDTADPEEELLGDPDIYANTGTGDPVQLFAEEHNQGDLFLYEPGVGPTDKQIKPDDSQEVPYGQDAYVYGDLGTYARYFKITALEVGRTGLKAKTETIGDTDYTYYTIPASCLKTGEIVLSMTTDIGTVFYLDVPNTCTVNVTAKNARFFDGPPKKAWTLPATVKTFTYTIETREREMLTEVSFPDDVEVARPVVTKREDSLLYTFTAEADAVNGETLYCYAPAISRLVRVPVDDTDLDPEEVLVTENGRICTLWKKDKGSFFYTVQNPYATISVSATAKTGYRLTGKANVDDGYAEKTLALKDGAVSFPIATVKPNSNYQDLFSNAAVAEVTFETEPDLTMQLQMGSTKTVYPNNAKITGIKPTDTPVIILSKGGHLAITESQVTVSPQTAGFCSVNIDGDVEINPAAATDAKERKVTIKIPDPDAPNKTLTASISFSVMQPIANVKIAGEKPDRTDKTKSTLTQAKGTRKEYAITLDKSMDINHLKATLPSGVRAKTAVQNGCLVIDTSDNDWRVAESDFEISLIDTKGDSIAGNDVLVKTVTVRLTAAALKEPKAQINAVSDIGMNLTVTNPKGLDNIWNLYYVITAKARGECDPKMNEEIEPIIKKIEGDSAVFFLQLAKSSQEGEGAEQAYDIEVTIVQTGNENAPTFGDGTNIIAHSRAKALKNQKTKKPNVYEVKLGVTKKTTTFIQGEKNIPVAKVKFSKRTSYTDAVSATVVDADGKPFKDEENNPISIDVEVAADGVTLILKDTSAIPVGKAFLKAEPHLPEGTYCVPATVPLTVKAPIKKIVITPAKNYLYKEDGKDVSQKYTALLYDENGKKPASNKVRWEVVPETADSPLWGHIQVKNGTVTIDKDVVLDTKNRNTNNTFVITAYADDVNGNATACSAKTILTSEPQRITEMKLESSSLGSVTVNDSILLEPDDLTDATIFFKGNNGTLGHEDLTMKVSPAGLTLERYTGSQYKVTGIAKAGTYTVTATTTDRFKDKYTARLIISDPKPQFLAYAGDYSGRDDITFGDDHVATLDNAALRRFTVVRTDCRLEVADTKVRVKNGTAVAKTLKRNAEGYSVMDVAVNPKKLDADVTVEYAGTTYTIKNTLRDGWMALDEEMTQSEAEPIYAGSSWWDTYLYFVTNKYSNILTDTLLFTPTAAYMKASGKKKAAYDALKDQLRYSGGGPGGDPYFACCGVSAEGVPAGKYTFDVVLCKDDISHPLTKPLSVTINVRPAPKKESLRIEDPNRIKVMEKDAGYAEINLTCAPATKWKWVDDENYAEVLNINDNGVIRPFREYIQYVQTNTGANWLTLRAKSKAFEGLSPGESRVVSGYIRYKAYGCLGKEITNTEKVTVTFSK
ncbi:MAG: hypothetical protein J6Y57_07425 [Lachnospiraceae bacterium]|nr:hypothetical protein [Lachnospiraceae bacterium]